VTESQLAELDGVQLQLVPVATSKLPVVEPAPTLRVVADNV
jgi:hypothetical protein